MKLKSIENNKVVFTKNAKNLLAKMMAEEDIKIQYRNVHTASFDVINRVLTVPIWKEMSADLADLILGHEVAHALWTPSDEDVLEDAINRSNKDFVNVVEDARIEKKIKKRFPGLRGPMYRGYKELEEKNFFGIKDKELSSLNFIDRINIFYKASMSDAEMKSIFSNEEISMVSKVGKTETFSEVADVAEEIFNWLKENAPEQSFSDSETSQEFEIGEEESFDPSAFSIDIENTPLEDDDSPENETDGSDSNQSSDEEDSNESSENSESNSQSDSSGGEDTDNSENENSQNTDNSDCEQTGSVSNGQSGSRNLSTNENENEFVSITDSSFSENLKTLVDHNANEIDNIIISDIDLKRHVTSYKEYHNMVEGSKKHVIENYSALVKENDCFSLYKKVLSENNASIGYLVKEFELKKSAEEYARSYQAKSGNINSSKLWSYQLNEDIFKKKMITPEGKNHGMVMITDWSGSMHDQLYDTVVQTIILATFCRRAGIPFDVYNFSDNKRHTKGYVNSYHETKQQPSMHSKTVIDHDVVLQHVLSSSMKKSEFQKACDNYLFVAWAIKSYWGMINTTELQLGGTPLNHSLLILDKVLHEFKQKHGIEKLSFIVLTDGGAGDQIKYMNHTISQNREDIYERAIYEAHRNIKTHLVYHERTKKTFVFKNGNPAYDKDATNTTEFLVKMLKEVHSASSIGFFVCSRNRDVTGAIQHYCFRKSTMWPRRSEISPLRSKLKKEGFISANNCGYDDYYIIDMRTQNVEEQLTIDEHMTKAKIARQFSKFQSSKKVSRAMLNKFVDNIK